jgi:hypothetical protein
VSDGRAAAGPHMTTKAAPRRAAGEANEKDGASDGRAAAGPHMTTKAALCRAAGEANRRSL